ncbi:MAG: sigma-70 family RNA polymerase sigma factor [Pirellula sp.]
MSIAPNTRNSLIARLSDITDHDAWREFAALYDPFIYRQARRYGLQHADARESVQEILIAVSKAVRKFEVSPDRGRFRTWLYAVGRNVCLRYLSRLRSRELSGENTEVTALLAAVPSPDSLESQEISLELQRHIFISMSQQIRSEFHSNTWMAFWQTAVENHSVQVVANGLKMSVGSVYVARSRVMARLKQRIQEVVLEDELEVIELLKKLETA